ncbi:MAG TPA: hypothetical protein PLZ68_09095 [Ferruginibacter sp.]|nr:hypothetical protein [Ferruginibacter sp.]
MKKTALFIACCALSALTVQAKIWRVNNNTGVTANFTTVQAAHDGALAGDTIHLEPSLNTYGNLIMSKRLVIISTGQFISQNPGIQFDPKPAFVGRITISNSGANNSVIMVRFSDQIYINSAVSGINLIGCAATAVSDGFADNNSRTGVIGINNADNIVIKNCMVNFIRFDNNSNNIIITNNIIAYAVYNDPSSDGIVSNNVIHAVGSSQGIVEALSNCSVSNNIFNKTVQAGFSNCNLSNNIAPNTGIPADNSNLQNVDMSGVFVNNNGGYLDNVYQLKPGSPAIGAGEAGVDCGAFGGASPFKLALTPPIPSIYKLSLPANPSGSSMTLIFSTKSN